MTRCRAVPRPAPTVQRPGERSTSTPCPRSSESPAALPGALRVTVTCRGPLDATATRPPPPVAPPDDDPPPPLEVDPVEVELPPSLEVDPVEVEPPPSLAPLEDVEPLPVVPLLLPGDEVPAPPPLPVPPPAPPAGAGWEAAIGVDGPPDAAGGSDGISTLAYEVTGAGGGGGASGGIGGNTITGGRTITTAAGTAASSRFGTPLMNGTPVPLPSTAGKLPLK